MLRLSIAFGLVLIVLGGEALVPGGEALARGAVAPATRLDVSPLPIGLIVVGFGTATPELVTSLQAAFAGSPGIAVGDVVGHHGHDALGIPGERRSSGPFRCRRRSRPSTCGSWRPPRSRRSGSQ